MFSFLVAVRHAIHAPFACRPVSHQTFRPTAVEFADCNFLRNLGYKLRQPLHQMIKHGTPPPNRRPPQGDNWYTFSFVILFTLLILDYVGREKLFATLRRYRRSCIRCKTASRVRDSGTNTPHALTNHDQGALKGAGIPPYQLCSSSEANSVGLSPLPADRRMLPRQGCPAGAGQRSAKLASMVSRKDRAREDNCLPLCTTAP
jgi:hypothetical protein